MRAGRLAAAAGLDAREVYRAGDGTDRYAAVRFAGRRVDVRRPGVDVTVSAPKSVSVLFGLAGPNVAAEVVAARRVAVGEALSYLESQAGHGLRGHQGDGQRAARIDTDGWIVAAFEHRTSRAGDPQLHTHLVVPNLLHGADGHWSALDSRALHRHALTGSYVYHAVLRGPRGRSANHLYVPEPDARDPLTGDELDQVAARLATRRAQTLATRQLPRHLPDPWERARQHTPPHRSEGISR